LFDKKGETPSFIITISFPRILLSCPPFREFHVMDRLAPPCQPAFAKIAGAAVNPPDRKSKICSAEAALRAARLS